MSEPVDELREDAALMRAMVECRVESVGLDQWARAWKRAEQMMTAEADRLSRLLPTGAAGERLRPIEDVGLAGVGIPRTEQTLGVNFASQMVAKHSEGEPDSRVGLPHASPVPTPAREPVAWAVARDSDGRISFDGDGCTRLLRTEELADEEAGRYMAHYGSGHSAVALYTHPPTPEAGTVTEHGMFGPWLVVCKNDGRVLSDHPTQAEAADMVDELQDGVNEYAVAALAGRRGA